MGHDRVVTEGLWTRQVEFRAQQEQYHYVGPLLVLGVSCHSLCWLEGGVKWLHPKVTSPSNADMYNTWNVTIMHLLHLCNVVLRHKNCVLFLLLYWMPLVTGDELMSQVDLNPQPSGYFHGYNASIDASIANSFAAGAFRFGHTLLPVSPALAQPVCVSMGILIYRWVHCQYSHCIFFIYHDITSVITQQPFANCESYIFGKHHSQQELHLTWTWELEKTQ